MSYNGDVFTYRAAQPDRSPRQAAPSRAPRSASPDRLTAWERLAQAESALEGLMERVEQLGGMVRELMEAAEASKARVHSARPVGPPVAEEPRQPERVAPAVVQTMQGVPEPPVAPPADVKVSFFADGTTKAVVGQAKVIQQ